MKKLLLSLLFVSSVAQSAVIAESNNGAGGKVLLFDGVCKTNQNMRAMLGYDGDGNWTTGCWLLSASEIVIKWADGDIRRYSVKVFQIVGGKDS
jgi:hypothetical protein